MSISVGINSYVTLAEANAYFDSRTHTEIWDIAADADRERALIWAAKLLDSAPWRGRVSDPEQAMAWPRRGVIDSGGRCMLPDAVPLAVKDAQCETALWLLSSDPNDATMSNMRRIQVDVIEIEQFARQPDRAMPKVAFQYVRQFLDVGDNSVRLTC